MESDFGNSEFLTDEALMARKSDEAKFRILVNRNRVWALGIAFSKVGNWTDAEDAAQAAFWRVWRTTSFKSGRRFRAWFRRIITNECTTILQKRRRHETTLIDDLAVSVSTPSHPAKEVEVEERKLVLEEALSCLDEKSRQLLRSCHMDGLAYTELSAQLGISVEACRTRVFRARKKLEKELGRLGVTKRDNLS